MKPLIAYLDATENKGVSVDHHGTIDSNPDRLDFRVKPYNCTMEEFENALQDSDLEEDICKYGGSEGHYADIGGASIDFKPGTFLVLTKLPEPEINDWGTPYHYEASISANVLEIE
ncbi:hypothetical protein [Neptuniibacter sp. QD37_11]|uniref:hypothetical protein n=1 Tax=Neptuniibacter sp. QD37_11 TaxID=3398209 RepID=UPI0039F55831